MLCKIGQLQGDRLNRGRATTLKRPSPIKPADGVMRKGMNSAVFWLVIIGPVLIGLAAAIWYGESKTFGLWTGFAGIVLLILAAAIQLQQSIWNAESAPPLAPPPPAKEALLPQEPQQRSRPAPEQGPVVWNWDLQFLVVTGGGPDAKINSIILQGTSTTSVTITEAYAVSGLTGHKQELMANVQYKGYYPVNQVDIPPDAPVWLELLFKSPLSVKDFTDQWGRLSVTIAYSDGTVFRKDFSESFVQQKLERMVPGAFGPHVTPRDDK